MLWGFAAYIMWGFFPAFFPLLEPAAPVEILAHRFIWTLVFVLLLLLALRRIKLLREITPREWIRVAVASLLISVNWGLYIYAVNSGHVADAALGYFINPLVSVVLGVLLLRESLRPMQKLSVAIAAVAVVILTIALGQPPIISLGLALSFGSADGRGRGHRPAAAGLRPRRPGDVLDLAGHDPVPHPGHADALGGVRHQGAHRADALGGFLHHLGGRGDLHHRHGHPDPRYPTQRLPREDRQGHPRRGGGLNEGLALAPVGRPPVHDFSSGHDDHLVEPLRLFAGLCVAEPHVIAQLQALGRRPLQRGLHLARALQRGHAQPRGVVHRRQPVRPRWPRGHPATTGHRHHIRGGAAH